MELLRRAGLSQKKVDGWIVNGTGLPYQKETWQRLGLDAKKSGPLRMVLTTSANGFGLPHSPALRAACGRKLLVF